MVQVSLCCPSCGSDDVCKNGHSNGKQRYLCRNSQCSRKTFYADYTYNGCKEFDVGEHLDQSSAVQCVCDLFGPADLQSIFEDAQLEGRLREEQATVRKFLGGDLRDKMDLAFKATPTFHVNKSSAPFLIFHGDKDMIVPIRQSERLHEELKKAGVESEFVVVKDAAGSL